MRQWIGNTLNKACKGTCSCRKLRINCCTVGKECNEDDVHVAADDEINLELENTFNECND